MDRTIENILNELLRGNERFCEGRLQHPRQALDRVAAVAAGQQPFAAIVGCSDSRVPPEILFDQGIGDLFVVRAAGNVVSDVAIGTLEYAALHLGLSLIVVLGHTRCGAVIATVKGGEVPGKVASVVDAIAPSVAAAREQGEENLVDRAARLHVAAGVARLRSAEPVLSTLVAEGKVAIAGGIYDLDTGRVEITVR